MSFSDEIKHLIKTQCSLVFLETIEEEYVVTHLNKIAEQNGFYYYEWSVVDGLHRGNYLNSYYQSKDPSILLQTISYLAKNNSIKNGLFILKDFHKYLDNDVVLRLFKDLIELLSDSSSTIILIGSDYSLPKDIQSSTAHIIGGYPDEQEICSILQQLFQDTSISEKKLTVSLTPAEIQRFACALKGLTVRQIKTIFKQCVVEDHVFDKQDFTSLILYKKKIFDQAGVLEYCLPESAESMAGFDHLKSWIHEREAIFREPNPSLPPPKGVLLMGVQGCGKSLAVKVIAHMFDLPLYRLDLGKLYNQYIGETENNLRKTLTLIEKMSPLCLWIDEIEKGISGSEGQIDGGVSQRILSTLLTWMQEREAKVFIAATANNVYSLPPELLRKGRFDEVFFVDLPNLDQRNSIFSIHLKRHGLSPETFDLNELSAESENFSGAEIEQVVISGLYHTAGQKGLVTTEIITQQIRSTKPLAVFRSEEIAQLREWARERTVPV